MSTTSPESERTRAGRQRGAAGHAATDPAGPWVGLRDPGAARLDPSPRRRGTRPTAPEADGAPDDLRIDLTPGDPARGAAGAPSLPGPAAVRGSASW